MTRYVEKLRKDLAKVLASATEQEWHRTAFQWGLYASYALAIATALGAAFIKPEYLRTVEQLLQIYVSLFLVIRFNPIVRDKMRFDKHDAKVAFSSGLFLLFTTVLTGTLEKVSDYLKSRASDGSHEKTEHDDESHDPKPF